MSEKQAVWLPEFLKRRLLNWAEREATGALARPSLIEQINRTVSSATGSAIQEAGKHIEPALQRHIPEMGQSIGEAMLRGAETRIEPVLEEKVVPFMKSIQRGAEQTLKKIPDVAREAVEKGTEQLADTAAGTARSLSGAAGLGGLAGAVAAPEDERMQGALRGALGGVLGGAGGAAWGRLLPQHSLLPAIGGAILGGTAGGATLRIPGREEGTFGDPGMESPREFDKESSMQGHKYAGVTLDYYDDRGETLKQKFPTLDKVPDIIKEATIQPKNRVPNEDFALIMIDGGHVFRKYACADAGTTALSVIYFMEHGDKLPEEAQKTAASNLLAACLTHDLLPPASLTKKAELLITPPPPVVGKKKLRMLSSDEEAQKVASIVDVTGKRPSPRIKVAAPTKDEDYAVVMPDGSRHYPIHSWDLVKKAEDYFLENRIRFQPEIRRQFAVKLASKAAVMGYPISREVASLGAKTYAVDNELRDALDMRKIACDPKSGSREILDDLFEKRASIHPEVFAECLKRFDVAEGLDKGWDKIVPDPWSSTFGIKTAAEVVWQDGADSVTRDALENLACNRLQMVIKEFTYDVAKEFKKDPIGIFESMPTPYKRVMARMASDAEADGDGEKGTNEVFEGTKPGPVEFARA